MSSCACLSGWSALRAIVYRTIMLAMHNNANELQLKFNGCSFERDANFYRESKNSWAAVVATQCATMFNVWTGRHVRLIFIVIKCIWLLCKCLFWLDFPSLCAFVFSLSVCFDALSKVFLSPVCQSIWCRENPCIHSFIPCWCMVHLEDSDFEIGKCARQITTNHFHWLQLTTFPFQQSQNKNSLCAFVCLFSHSIPFISFFLCIFQNHKHNYVVA